MARLFSMLAGMVSMGACQNTDINAGRKAKTAKAKRKIVDKQGKEWPECAPPDPADPYGEVNNNLNVNGTQYKCSPEGRWVVDEKSMQALAEYEAERRQFASDISTRKLSPKELMRLSPKVNLFPNETYYAAGKYAELYEMLAKQWELQHGHPLPLYTPLSSARGDYGRSPQEGDNKLAVERLIRLLQGQGE